MAELMIESNLKSLAEKIKSSRQLIRSEEHTKMAYIVPFIALLIDGLKMRRIAYLRDLLTTLEIQLIHMMI